MLTGSAVTISVPRCAESGWQRIPASDPSGRVGLSGEISIPSPCLPVNSPDIGPLALSCDHGGQELLPSLAPALTDKSHRAIPRRPGVPRLPGFPGRQEKRYGWPLRRVVIGRRCRLGVARGVPTTTLRHVGRPPESRRGDHQSSAALQDRPDWAGLPGLGTGAGIITAPSPRPVFWISLSTLKTFFPFFFFRFAGGQARPGQVRLYMVIHVGLLTVENELSPSLPVVSSPSLCPQGTQSCSLYVDYMG